MAESGKGSTMKDYERVMKWEDEEAVMFDDMIKNDPKRGSFTAKERACLITVRNRFHSLARQVECLASKINNFYIQQDKVDRKDEFRTGVRDWLKLVLKDGPVPAEQVWGKAKVAGIPKKILKEVREELGVASTKIGGKGEPWVWQLPNLNGKIKE